MRSFGELDERRKCCLRGCDSRRNGTPFCEHHWSLIPDDLQHRISWAYDDGDAEDRYAANAAASAWVREILK